MKTEWSYESTQTQQRIAIYPDSMPQTSNKKIVLNDIYKQEPTSNFRQNGFLYSGGLISKFQPVGS